MKAINERSKIVVSGQVTRVPSDESSVYAVYSQDLPAYQRRNWHLATKVYEYICDRDSIAVAAKSDLNTAAGSTIPARMEIFQLNGRKIILDGAHNPQKLAALFDSIRQQYPNQSIAVLYAMLKSGKEKFDNSIAIIMKDCSEVIVTSFRVTQDLHRHGSDPEKIALALKESVNVSVVRDPIKAFDQLLERNEPILLVTGSFYLITKIRPVLLNLTKNF
jgi:dihydrofolate synthase/folylpolyglutamate synthase